MRISGIGCGILNLSEQWRKKCVSLRQEKVAGFNVGKKNILVGQVGNGEKEASVVTAAFSAFVHRNQNRRHLMHLE